MISFKDDEPQEDEQVLDVLQVSRVSAGFSQNGASDKVYIWHHLTPISVMLNPMKHQKIQLKIIIVI